MAKKSTRANKKPADENTDPKSNTPFIDSRNAADAYHDSNKWFRPYFDPIEEFERIARNRPSDKIDPQLPKITDGTLAAIVQEQPKRVVQQIATGRIDCNEYPEFAKIADMIHTKKLIPSYNRMGTALQKHWNMLGKAMTWGRSTSYTFFTSTNNELHTDFVIPYVKDIITEKGKVFAPDSNISFMRSWYQKRDIQAIIRREKAFMERDKNYKPEWDLDLLARFMNEGASAKSAELQTPAEKEKGGDAGGFEVIHAFQNGLNAEFYSFAPRFKDGETLRTKVNKDPRGKMPLDHLYSNIDLSNPLGRGQVELSGGIQNLIDQQMQMFQFLTTLLMGPPLQAYGDVKKHTLKFRPNAIWDMGTSANNKVVPYEVNNYAVQQFGSNYGLLKSQVYNLNSSQDHSISAESGNIAQSKTQAGVQAAEARLGVSDNYLRKQFESWFNDQAETSINIYLSEMQGSETIDLEAKEVKEIAKTESAKYLDGKRLVVPYKDIKDVAFYFHVDASSSEIKVDLDNADKLTSVLKLIQESEDPKVRESEVKINKKLIEEIGAEGTDDIFEDEEELDQDGQPIQKPQGPDPQQLMQQMLPTVQQMIQEAVQQAKIKPDESPTLQLIKALGLKFEALPEQARQLVLEDLELATGEPTPADRKQDVEALDAIGRAEPQDPRERQQTTGNAPTQQQSTTGQQPQPQQPDQGLSPDEEEFVAALLRQGFSDEDAEQGVIMLRSGRPLEEIIQVLGGKYVQR